MLIQVPWAEHLWLPVGRRDQSAGSSKDSIMQKVAQNGTLYQKLLQYMQLALAYAQRFDPKNAELIARDVLMMNGGRGLPTHGASARLTESDNIAGIGKSQTSTEQKARSRTSQASQPS